MTHFKTADSVGAWQTMTIMGVGYFVFMSAGALGYRVSPEGWRPDGWTPPGPKARAMITHASVALEDAHKTPQFWLIWAVLCLNVSAGIGVLSMASPMLQEIFGGRLIGHPETGFAALDAAQKTAIAKIAAGLRRAAFAVQHRRPLLLGLDLGQDRPQGDLFLLLRARDHPLRARRRRSPIPGRRRCSSPRSASSCRCTAAASPRCRPISPTSSARASSAPSTAAC